MDWKLELVFVPVRDVDRAKAFYVDQVGFGADHDHQVTDTLRFVQLTPPGSACSIAMGTGVTDMQPGSQQGLQIVVDDVEAARKQLVERGVPASEVDCKRGDRSSPSATPTATHGRCNSYRPAGDEGPQAAERSVIARRRAVGASDWGRNAAFGS